MASHFRFHALHIPEIAGIIVSFLTWKDLLVCRGVSHEWRSLFSPHLHLSAIYWKQNQDERAQQVQRLETLGPFVDSLRVVYPFAQELETISRSCTNLTHIGFFFSFRDTSAVHVGALQQFLATMQTLQSIDVFSHNDDARTAILYCLATYPSTKPSETSSPSPASSSPDSCHSPSSANTTNIATTTSTPSTPPPQQAPTTGVLKKLKIEHGGYSMKVALLRWDHVEAVLERNQSITHLHLQEAIVKTNAELLANPEDEDLDWTEDLTSRVLGSLPIKRRFTQFLNRLSSLAFRRRSVSGPASTSTTATATASIAPAPTGLSTQDEATSPTTQPEPLPTLLPNVVFGNIKSVVLHQITMSKELYCSLLSRCPQLTTLEVTGTGSDVAASWWDWIEHCPLLESVLIDQHLSMDIRDVWARAPTCLRSFQMNDIDWVVKTEASSNSSSDSNSGGSGGWGFLGNIGMTAGSTLTRLHLETSQHIGEPVIHYIMQHCWSLQSLCLAVKTYDAQNFSKIYGEYPQWACGDTLRSLEIKALHESYGDVLSLWTVQKFLQRTEDLKVLEEVTLPLPFMGDIYRATGADRTLLKPPLPSVQKLTLKGYRENQLWSDNIRLIVQWMPSLQVLWTPYRVFDRDRLAAIKET
ncbi:hypothetical protein BG005_008557 [Podila minutissima]|nr:hypothetical protein BG005_008557 [Podila minutissima]